MHRPPCAATLLACAAALALTTGAARAHDDGANGPIGPFGTHNVKPRLISSPILSTYYGAGDCPTPGLWCGPSGDDLLTGGLGATGLLLAAPVWCFGVGLVI